MLRHETNQLSHKEKYDYKLKVFRKKQCRKIVREIIVNFIFIGILFAFIYSTKNSNSYYYANHTKTSFSGYQTVASTKELYAWLTGDLLSSFLTSNYSNFTYFLNDASSIVIGYPIIRQLRTIKSKRFFSQKDVDTKLKAKYFRIEK